MPKLEGSWIGKTVGELWDELPEEERAGRKPPSADQREKIISPNRLQTIYRTNMAVAYQAGKYRQQLALAHIAPFWRYRTIGDASVREAHKALDGKVFRYDDPFWKTHYPPNGWGCRCYVEALDQDDLDEDGLTVTDSRGHMVTKEYEPNGETVVGYNFDGQTTYTAPGWSYNPGNDQQFIDTCERKAERYPEPIQEQFKADLDEARAKAEDEARAATEAKVRASMEEFRKQVSQTLGGEADVQAVAKVEEEPEAKAVEVQKPPVQAKATSKPTTTAKKATGTAKKPSAKRQRKQNLQALAALIASIEATIRQTSSELEALQAQAEVKKANLERLGTESAVAQAFASAFADQNAVVQADLTRTTDLLARASALYGRLSSKNKAVEFAEEQSSNNETNAMAEYYAKEAEKISADLDRLRRLVSEGSYADKEAQKYLDSYEADQPKSVDSILDAMRKHHEENANVMYGDDDKEYINYCFDKYSNKTYSLLNAYMRNPEEFDEFLRKSHHVDDSTKRAKLTEEIAGICKTLLQVTSRVPVPEGTVAYRTARIDELLNYLPDLKNEPNWQNELTNNELLERLAERINNQEHCSFRYPTFMSTSIKSGYTHIGEKPDKPEKLRVVYEIVAGSNVRGVYLGGGTGLSRHEDQEELLLSPNNRITLVGCNLTDDEIKLRLFVGDA